MLCDYMISTCRIRVDTYFSLVALTLQDVHSSLRTELSPFLSPLCTLYVVIVIHGYPYASL